MLKINYFTLSALILALAGFVFSLEFQGMAYWGKDGAVTMQWYWLGACLAYTLSITSIITMFLKLNRIHNGGLDYLIRIMSSLLIIASLMWTTFIIIAWQSGF